MTIEELLTSGWAVALGLLIVLAGICIAGYINESRKDVALDYERKRNERLVTRIMNLQSLVRIQDHMLEAKIERILNEDIPVPGAPLAESPGYLSVDAIVASMEYCYECHAMKGPAHFNQPGHRKTPAPDLVDG